VIEFALMRAQTGFDIAKALSISELRERHAEVLIETTEAFDISFALVALHTTPERMHWKVVGHLRVLSASLRNHTESCGICSQVELSTPMRECCADYTVAT
jgi:hypothetical protein